MLAWTRQAALGTRSLEGLLQQVLVPVEPAEQFTRSLKARLVVYRGREAPPVWVLVGALASALLLAAGMAGLFLRLGLVLAGLLAVSRRARRRAARARA
jgi:hypothetical protein